MNGPICAEDTGVVMNLSVLEWGALGKQEAKVSKGRKMKAREKRLYKFMN